MNLRSVTVEDAVENYYRKGMAIICNSGEVKGFEKDDERGFYHEERIFRFGNKDRASNA